MDSIPEGRGLSVNFEFVDAKKHISYFFHKEGYLQEKVELSGVKWGEVEYNP